MKKSVKICIIIFFITSIGLQAQTKKETKKIAQQEGYNKMKELISSGVLIFNVEWAIAQSGAKINFNEEGYFLKIEKNMTNADLPFFGEAQVASYGKQGGIEYEVQKTILEIKYVEEKSEIIIKFKASQKSESFDVSLTVFSNGRAILNISSNIRNRMRYDGKVTPIKIKNK